MRFSESFPASHASLLIQPPRPMEARAYVRHHASVLAVAVVLGESGRSDRQVGSPGRKRKASQILPLEKFVAERRRQTGGHTTGRSNKRRASSKLREPNPGRAHHEDAYISPSIGRILSRPEGPLITMTRKRHRTGTKRTSLGSLRRREV